MKLSYCFCFKVTLDSNDLLAVLQGSLAPLQVKKTCFRPLGTLAPK